MVSPMPRLIILLAISGFSAMYALRRRPISGNKYPPANLAKFSLRSTPEYSCVLEADEEVLEYCDEGANALTEENVARRQKLENFIV